MRTSLRDEMVGKRREFNELCRKISNLPIGPVRMELKRRRNELAGQIVVYRQMLIRDELTKENPQHVPRETFDQSGYLKQ